MQYFCKFDILKGMKRILLFVVVNMAVMLLSVIAYHLICYFFGIDPSGFSMDGEMNLRSLFVFCVVFGMLGSFVSLLFSKTIAKLSTGAVVIDGSEGEAQRWIVDTVRNLADSAGIAMPEVAIYEGAPNAFATGAFRNKALVAVSTDLVRGMRHEELRAVLGHEISHIANGDMVTMTLLQGVLNAIVLFLSRVIAQIVASSSKGESRRSSPLVYFAVYYALQISLGLLASMIVLWYSRRREFSADAGSAKLIGSPQPMILALKRLQGIGNSQLPSSMKAFGISGDRGASLFSSHPTIEKRIEALEQLSYTSTF